MFRILIVGLALTAGVVALAGLPDDAIAQKRVALVIGNSAYQHTPALNNPKNDAADMAASLKAHDFRVIEGLDLDKTAFDRRLREFATALKGAEVGIFFYAGHGLQVNGQNYLVPVDAKAEGIEALEFEMVKITVVHSLMEQSTPTNILLLDACRNNPLSRNLARAMGARAAQIGRGLRSVEAGVGTLISFSTAPDTVASDGVGRNSPYTGSLVKHVAGSTDDLSTILINVRRDVRRETQGQQVPWEHSSLEGKFYFNQAAGGEAHAEKVKPERLSEAAEAWRAIRDNSNVSDLEAYILRFKDTFYSDLALQRLSELTKKVPAGAQIVHSLAAGVDCTRKIEMHEETVCKEYDLVQSDRSISTNFLALFVQLDSSEQEELKKRQQEWKEIRAYCGANLSCLRIVYKQRVDELNEVDGRLAKRKSDRELRRLAVVQKEVDRKRAEAEATRSIVEEIVSGRRTNRPWLGARLEDLTPHSVATLGLQGTAGALIARLSLKGPAAEAGLEIDDVIVSVDDKEVSGPSSARHQLHKIGIGNTARLAIVRKGKRIATGLTLISGPAPARDDAMQLQGQHPFDGTRVAKIGPAVAEELGVEEQEGVFILSVRPNSIAARLGLKAGDLVSEVMRQKVGSIIELHGMLKERQRVSHIIVRRGAETLTLRAQHQLDAGRP